MLYVVLAVLFAVTGLVAPRYLPQDGPKFLRPLVRAVCGALAVILVLSTSFTYISKDQVGHLNKRYGTKRLQSGQIIATHGEKGPQAEILPPGWIFRLFLNVAYTVDKLPVTVVPEGHYGYIVAADGKPLHEGQYLAAGWPEAEFSKMLDAKHFLEHGGQKGPQLSVLKPGQYRMNAYLFHVKAEQATAIETGEVGVVKSNVQEVENCAPVPHRYQDALSVPLVPKGCIGVWSEPLFPNTYYLNRAAYHLTKISTRVHAWEYKGGYKRRFIDLSVDQKGEIKQSTREEDQPVLEDSADSAIFARVEGWVVPLELRAMVQVAPEDAPFVAASVGGIQEIEDKVLTPTIRSVVRNVAGAQDRKVLDLQDNRSRLEDLVEEQIRPEGMKAGISIREVRFGDPAIPPELLVARLREQLATQLTNTYKEEQKSQAERIRTEKARAEADQQDELVKSEIAVKVAGQRKLAAQLEGEGERMRLTEIAAGQKAQAAVLGEEKVLSLAMLKELLAAAVANPNIVKVPHILVQGEGGGGLAGAAAILGQSNLVPTLQVPDEKEKK